MRIGVKISSWYLLINIPEIGVFSPNIVIFAAKIGRIRNLWLSKLVCLPDFNDLSTLCPDAKRLFCILNKSLSSDSNARVLSASVRSKKYFDRSSLFGLSLANIPSLPKLLTFSHRPAKFEPIMDSGRTLPLSARFSPDRPRVVVSPGRRIASSVRMERGCVDKDFTAYCLISWDQPFLGHSGYCFDMVNTQINW